MNCWSRRGCISTSFNSNNYYPIDLLELSWVFICLRRLPRKPLYQIPQGCLNPKILMLQQQFLLFQQLLTLDYQKILATQYSCLTRMETGFETQSEKVLLQANHIKLVRLPSILTDQSGIWVGNWFLSLVPLCFVMNYSMYLKTVRSFQEL